MNILNLLGKSPKEDGGLSDIMKNSRQWERVLTPEQVEWYNHWLPIIRVQLKRVRRNIAWAEGRSPELGEMNDFWRAQL